MATMGKIAESTKVQNSILRMARNVNNCDPTQNILIFSEPRGGSTWLTEMVQHFMSSPVLWEPLFLTNAPAFRRLNFGWRPIIPRTADAEPAYRTFQQLFRGRFVYRENCILSEPRDFVRCANMTVKFCRANGLLPWIARNFKLTYKPVYLLRHPFAVVASQINYDAWNNVNPLKKPASYPYPEYFQRHETFLADLKTLPERLLAVWCITNREALRALDSSEWHTIFYEDLLADPERELGNLFHVWGMDAPDFASSNIRKPSQSVKSGTNINDIEKQLTKWHSFFDHDDIKRMLYILDYFKISVYNSDPFPVHRRSIQT